MGAQQSYVRGVSTNGGDRVSIFKLLLQFTTIGDTNEGNEGLTYLFRALLDTKIDDVSYEVLEVYLRNFVLHNLLNINLRHGKLYCYWDRYAALLEQIVKYESLAPLHPSDDTNGSIGCTTIPSGSTQRIIIEEILDSTSGGCDEPQLGGGLLHDGDCMAPTPDTQSQKPSEMFIVTNMADKSNSRLRKDGSAKITTHDGTDIGSYIGIVKGLSDPTRSLTLFVISKILFKCLIDTIDTAEILFHMDYLPYYLVPDALSFFNLDIAERKEAIPECTSEKPACHNISDDQVVDEADKCSDTICESSDEHSIASSSISIEAKSNNCGAMILRFCTEVHTITVEVPAGAAWKQVADGVIIEAAKTWSHGTMEALRRGFCLVDERMRIFSLQNIGFLFDHTKEHVEFMVLPFCISTYGSIGATSHLKRLLQALFTYITADIRPISSSHGIFLRASQSMAADVLVILLSCIVMKPYLCTTAKAELDSQFPPNFKWVKRAPTSTRSVAPLHYIYLDRIRSQLMLDRRSEVDQRDVHPVIDYAMNYGDNIKYGLLESFRFSIGRCGLETAARCLIRLLKSNAPNSSKRHLNNIRNHMVLLLLLLLNPTETDAFPYPESDGHSTPSMTTFTNSIYTSLPSNIAKVLKEADVKVPEVFCNQSSQQSSTAVVDRQLPLELLVELGKSLLDMGAPKVCSNELLLVLVDILSNNREFTSTFYARAHNFVREVINTIRRNSTISKQKKYNYEVTKAPLLRTLIRILTHYIRHHKNHDIDNASLDMEHILQTIFDVFDWNFEVQKDNHLVNSLFLLVNHLVEMPIVINRFASEKILGLLSTWVSAASSFMDALPIQITHMDPACLDCLMLIKMVTAAMNVIKAALSPATLDSNLDLIHAILNCCTLDTLENMLFYLKDPRFDATFEFMKLGAIREHAVTMLDFVSLIVRTFMSFKMHSMYSFTRCKAGFSSRAVFEAVSDLIREINEETVDKKSALALAISGDFNTVVPPTGSAKELFHYHMSQLWIAAYGSQHQFTLWSSYTT